MEKHPDLKWYSDISADKNLAPRCPYASVHRCPRYYQSISLLGDAGGFTRIERQEDDRLLAQWERSDLWPVVAEQKTSIMGPLNDPRIFSNFCPEVSFDRFRWFAVFLARYADDTDVDVAHRNLSEDGAQSGDWRWSWGSITPMHYSDCPLYSPLLLGNIESEESAKKFPLGFYPDR